jgi:hypothetical protein
MQPLTKGSMGALLIGKTLIPPGGIMKTAGFRAEKRPCMPYNDSLLLANWGFYCNMTISGTKLGSLL